MYNAIVTWINSKGREQTRTFSTRKTCFSFLGVLDDRIRRGTCGGYTMTES